MHFETTMRVFLGDEAFGIECLAKNLTERKKWIKKIINKMIKIIDTIETTELHKQQLLAQLEEILVSLKDNKNFSDELIYHLLQLCGQFLGFSYSTGGVVRNLFYYQNEDQHYALAFHQGRNSEQERHQDQKDIVTLRAQIVSQMKEQGISNFKIAQVLSITEYRVKQLVEMSKIK